MIARNIMIAMILISLLPPTNSIPFLITNRARERPHWLCQKERTSSSRFFEIRNWRKKVADRSEYSTTTADDDVDGAFHDADKNVGHNVDGDAPLPQVIARENKGAGIGEMFRTTCVLKGS